MPTRHSSVDLADTGTEETDIGLAAVGSAVPRRRLAVLICMDARLHPGRFLDFVVGDAHVISNAGGRASDDAVRSLVVSARVLGTREVMVIHHTDCGMQKYSDDDLRSRLRADGMEPADIQFLTFGDLEDSVREDVARLREHPLLGADLSVSGYVYDLATDRLVAVTERG